MRLFVSILTLALLVFGLTLFSQPVTLNAQAGIDDICENYTANDPKAPTYCKNVNVSQNQGETNNLFVGPDGLLTKGANLLAVLVGVASVIGIILGGLRFVLASGDSGSVSKARNMVIYSVVGLVIAIFARAIVVFVISKL